MQRSTLDGRTHVKLKGTGLGNNEHVLGPAVFEKLVRKQVKEVNLHKFSMDRPKDFSVAASDGVFKLQADLSDKRCDVGYTEWHGCELLVTRPWVPRDYDGERGHPLCVPFLKGGCAICYETLGVVAVEGAEAVTHLKCCNHNLHSRCLQRWLDTQGDEGRALCCPFCRAGI